MRYAVALAALAAVVLIGSAVSPAGSWASLSPAPAPVKAVEPAPAIASAYVLAVAKPGQPGEYDAADYGLSLGDCFDALRALPSGSDAFCEAERL